MEPVSLDALQAAAYTLRDQRQMSQATNYFAWQGDLVDREIGQRVIEVGCGVGNFTRNLLEREAVLALDKEPRCIGELRHRYANQQNLQAHTCDAEALDERQPELASFGADSCVCLNVLEHIDDDSRALRGMGALLGAGGVIVLLVPAFPALYGPIDRNLRHYRRYTRDSMARLASKTGLLLRKAHYVNLPGFFGWWANSHLFKRDVQSDRQIEIFDKLVPAISRVEGWVHPPFGQSLFAVLHKPC